MREHARAIEPKRRGGGSPEIEKQRGAVVDALDRLFAHETPASGAPRSLRLVSPREDVLERNPVGEGLRAFLKSRGRDLWPIGGDEELFAAMRAVMTARPRRKAWNRTILSAVWGDVGDQGADD